MAAGGGKRHIFRLSISKLLFLLMAAYFVSVLILTKEHTQINYYEVEEGNLVREHSYHGLILRDETVVLSPLSGTIYYYVGDGRKVAKGSLVYCIDTSGDIAQYLSGLDSNTYISLNSDLLSSLRSTLTEDSRTFSADSFNMLYSVSSAIRSGAAEYSGQGMIRAFADDLRRSGISFEEFSAEANGTVCYYTDGFEDIRAAEVTSSLFDEASYRKSSISPGEIVQASTPAYKLITDENWSIVFRLSDDEVQSFSSGSQFRISFTDKGFNTVAPIEVIYGSDSEPYGLISMNSYQVQFTADRFVDFDIVTADVSGLKIPDKAITTKNLYCIPVDYLIEDDEGNQGFYRAAVGEDGYVYEFILTDIYSIDEEYCYIECEEEGGLDPGDYVALDPLHQKEPELYRIAMTYPIQGVYNINKGYTQFRQIEILESANGYTIVRKNTSYGLQPYDHIVLDASTVGDDQIILSN